MGVAKLMGVGVPFSNAFRVHRPPLGGAGINSWLYLAEDSLIVEQPNGTIQHAFVHFDCTKLIGNIGIQYKIMTPKKPR